jgi:Protein kinase domain
MGLVYRARDTRLNRDVAIKVLPEAFSTDRDRLRRFEQEARAAAALSHANIVSIYDVGTHEGQPYVVSELLEGQTLRDILRGGALPLDLALRYAMQLCQGLAAAHQRGIIHRDLKPENLFITKTGRLKILDFGLAKLVERSLLPAESSNTTKDTTTAPGVMIGTIGYMSPEQVLGAPTDQRSDIFSFGAILYEMVTGRRAFQEANPIETMYAILKSRPPSFSRIGGAVQNALDAIIRRCLEREPQNRFQMVGEIFKLRSAQLVLALAAESDNAAHVATTIELPGLDDDSAPQPHWVAWLGPLLGIAVILLIVVQSIAPGIPIWDELPPASRFVVLLLTVATFHLMGAVVSLHSETKGRAIHTIATLWFGAALFITVQIFDLDEYGPASILLWAIGSWWGWRLLNEVTLLALAAVLVPAGLAAQWQQINTQVIPTHRVGVLGVGLVLTSLAYLMAPGKVPFDLRDRVLRWIGGFTLIPAAVGLFVAGMAISASERSSGRFDVESLPIGLVLLGWATAVGFPTAVAAALRKRGAWVNAVAAGWAVIAIQIPNASNSSDLAFILWFAIGAIGLAASGVRESRPERINLGAAICGMTLIVLTVFAARFIGWAALPILGVCVWLLQRTRRRLAAAARGRT